MSEHPSEPTTAETAPVPVACEARSEPVVADAPAIAPDQELTAPVADAPKVEAAIESKAVEAKTVEPKTVEPKAVEPKVVAPKVESKAEAPKVELKTEAAKAEAPRSPAKVMIMSPGDRSWRAGGAKADAEPAANRARVPAMAAMIALATVAGALGGALVTAGLGFGHGGSTDVAAARNVGLEASIARLDSDVLALKANVEQTGKVGVSHFNKTNDRLDKVEKAQGEPSARLAKLSEEVSKLRAAQAAAAANTTIAPTSAQAASAAPVQAVAVPAAAAKDVTGSVASPVDAAAPPAHAATAKVEVTRLPTVEGWVLREAGRGSALIESRRGIFEVFAGDPVPGLGRIDAIRKQDGRWVVVTSKGLILPR